MRLSELKIGERATISHFTDQELGLKLMEMGCLPGEVVEIERIAPMGDPIAITVLDYSLSLRLEEADVLEVNPICFKG